LATSSTTIAAGFNSASSFGRGGKGCPIMVAAGGDAQGHGTFSWEGDLIPLDIFSISGAGNFRVVFSYEKNGSGSAGDDAVWLAEIYVPFSTGYSVYTFDNGSFTGTGWTPGGNAGWLLDHNDPAHMHGTSQYALRSGVIADNQTS